MDPVVLKRPSSTFTLPRSPILVPTWSFFFLSGLHKVFDKWGSPTYWLIDLSGGVPQLTTYGLLECLGTNNGTVILCVMDFIMTREENTTPFIPAIASTSGRLHSEFVRLLFLQAYRETDCFFASSGVQLAHTNPSGQFHFRRAALDSILKSRVGNILAKAAVLRINLNLDGVPIASKSHTHPSHSQTSRLLTSS